MAEPATYHRGTGHIMTIIHPTTLSCQCGLFMQFFYPWDPAPRVARHRKEVGLIR